jgi:hypothetical protein
MNEQVTEIDDLRDEGSDSFVAKAWRCVTSAATVSLRAGEIADDVKKGIWHAWMHDCDSSPGARYVRAAFHASLRPKCWLGRRAS